MDVVEANMAAVAPTACQSPISMASSMDLVVGVTSDLDDDDDDEDELTLLRASSSIRIMVTLQNY
jgi:hypothetical protein